MRGVCDSHPIPQSTYFLLVIPMSLCGESQAGSCEDMDMRRRGGEPWDYNTESTVARRPDSRLHNPEAPLKMLAA